MSLDIERIYICMSCKLFINKTIAVIYRASYMSYFFHIVTTRNMMHPLNISTSRTTAPHMEATIAMTVVLPMGAVLLEMAASTEALKH